MQPTGPIDGSKALPGGSIAGFGGGSATRPIFFSRPAIGELERERVCEALTRHVGGDGPFCQRAETRLSQMLEGRRVLLTTSCTHALELALLALGIGPGDEVICPSFTFVSTANAALRVGARPVLAEIAPDTLGLDPADVSRRITPRTAAVIPVHYAGWAVDMAGLSELARAHDLRIVEDAAHALGSRYRGRPLGALGDAGCFSFHESKNLSCGEGGAVAFADPEVARRGEIVREKGTNRRAFFLGEVDKYSWVAEGSSYVLSDVLGALLDAQLERFDEIQAERRRVVEGYRAGLAGRVERHGVQLPPQLPERSGCAHIFYLLYPDAARRNRCLKGLSLEGIGGTFHYVPLHLGEHGRRLGFEDLRLPVTERVSETLLRLPLHPGLSDDDVERVVRAVLRHSA